MYQNGCIFFAEKTVQVGGKSVFAILFQCGFQYGCINKRGLYLDYWLYGWSFGSLLIGNPVISKVFMWGVVVGAIIGTVAFSDIFVERLVVGIDI